MGLREIHLANLHSYWMFFLAPVSSEPNMKSDFEATGHADEEKKNSKKLCLTLHGASWSLRQKI